MATKREMTFAVKERGPGEPCFITAEGDGFYIGLLDPADIEHAREVARFLNKNVAMIRVDDKL